MRPAVQRGARLLVLPTIALVIVAAFVPGRIEPAVRIYALVVCAVALGLTARALHRAYPPVGRLRAERKTSDRRPEPVRSLARLENLAALGVADAQDLHFRLRLPVREVAAGLLESRRGISLDDDPEAARALLGDETWELVRRDRPAPEDRRAPGIPRAMLERVVVSLEEL